MQQTFYGVNNSNYDLPIGPNPVRMDGDTRIRDKPWGPDNLWDFRFNDTRRGQGDVYDWYRYTEVPNGNYIPRSRANGAEYRRNIKNEHFYRRENAYELSNLVIDPTHLDEMTPERIAADPNQAIYNYYYGLKDSSDKHMNELFQKSRWRDTVKKNKRRNYRQMLTAIDGGRSVKFEAIEPLYW